MSAPVEVDWFITATGKPLITLSTGSGRSTTLDVGEASQLVLDLLRAISASQCPDARQVSDERAP